MGVFQFKFFEKSMFPFLNLKDHFVMKRGITYRLKEKKSCQYGNFYIIKTNSFVSLNAIILIF